MTISIVTISFNQARFLREAIESVLSQRSSGTPVEYIVVDAGSTDGSHDIIIEFQDLINHIIMEPDNGPADGLNKGFALASGEIFGFVNADDRLQPGALAAVSHFFDQHPNLDGVVGATCILDQDGRPQRRVRASPPLTIRRYLDGRTRIWQQSTFFRSEAFRRVSGFNSDNGTCWDAELFIDLLLSGSEFGRLGRPLGEFRIYDTSITGQINSGAGGTDLGRRQQTDLTRIAGKAAAEGYRPSRKVLRPLLGLGYFLSPVRRGQELRLSLNEQPTSE